MRQKVDIIIALLKNDNILTINDFINLDIHDPNTMMFYLNIALMYIMDHDVNNIITTKQNIKSLIDNIEMQNITFKQSLIDHHNNIVNDTIIQDCQK